MANIPKVQLRSLIGSKRLLIAGTVSRPPLSGVANGPPVACVNVSANKLCRLWAALVLVFAALFGDAKLS
jgi:hypothetical protein